MGELHRRRLLRDEADPLAAARELRRRVRVGRLDMQRLERAAWLGDPAACLAVGRTAPAWAPRSWPRSSARAYRDPSLRPEVDRLAVWLGELESWGPEALVRALLAVLGLWSRHERPSQEREAIEAARVAIAVWLADGDREDVLRDALRPLRVRWQALGNGLRRWGERSVLFAAGQDLQGAPLPARACPWSLRQVVCEALVPWLLAQSSRVKDSSRR